MCPWECFGKALLTSPRKAIATCGLPAQESRHLPFEDGLFGAALCCGSLHLFADTVIALREIARVLKPAAILTVFTFTAGTGGIPKFRSVLEWSRRRHGLHVFDVSEMERHLKASGFEDFEPEVAGSILTFSARKRAA